MPMRNYLIFVCALSVLTTACYSSSVHIVKIGLVAPFEGRYRELGYDVIHAIRLAINEINSRDNHGASFALVAFDDGANPELAREQANKIATDPDVVAVLGHWIPETTISAAPIYSSEGIPFLATASGLTNSPITFQLYPHAEELIRLVETYQSENGDERELTLCECGIESVTAVGEDGGRLIVGPAVWSLSEFWELNKWEVGVIFVPVALPRDLPPASTFQTEYEELSGGEAPGVFAMLAYDSTKMLLEAIAASEIRSPAEIRTAINNGLSQGSYQGLAGVYEFDSSRQSIKTPASLYRWQDGNFIPATP